jgi:hypothetical protein
MSTCKATTLYFYPRIGPAPGNMKLRCQRESGHAGKHYSNFPRGIIGEVNPGISWAASRDA